MNTTPTPDDDLLAALRAAADMGVPAMRKDAAAVVLSAGQRARRRAMVARSSVALAGVAVLASGGVALAGVGPGVDAVAPATHVPVTEEQVLPELPPGPPDGVFTGTWREWATAYMSCMQSQGWDVELVSAEEGLGFEFLNSPERDAAELRASQDACSMSVGVKVEPERDDEAVRALYDENFEQYTCLVDAGFTPTEPPSFEVYHGMYRAGAVDADPMRGVADGDYFRALKACPRAWPAD